MARGPFVCSRAAAQKTRGQSKSSQAGPRTHWSAGLADGSLSFRSGGQLETWALLFPNQSKTCELSLAQTIQQYVLPLGHLDESGQHCILEALDQLSAPEKQVYFKIIRGGFRMGVKKALVIKGLAAASRS